MDRINRAAPGRPLHHLAEEATEPRNVRRRLAPSADSSLQGLAPRPDSTSTSRPPMRPSASIPAGRTAPAVLFDASNMLTGFDDHDMTPVTGRNTLNVLNHLHDLATLPPSQLAPRVREAALRACDDPVQLVHNLLALSTANPPVLSSRRGSSVQPANQPPGLIGAQVASQNTSELLRGFDSDLALPSLGSPLRARPSIPSVHEELRSARQAMSPEDAAVQWYRNRMEDLSLVEDVYPRYSEFAGQERRETERSRRALFRFAVRLSQVNAHDSLGAFLLRYGSTDTDVSGPARNQLDDFIANQAESSAGQGLGVALDLLCTIPTDQRDEMCRRDGMTEADVSNPHRRWLLPPPERMLLEPFDDFQSWLLSRFSAALLRGGHGGLSEWLAMFHNGRDRIARQLLSQHIQSQHRSSSLVPLLDRLQEQAGIPSARRLRVEGRNTFIGEHRPGRATEMHQRAAAVEPVHREMPPHDTHEDNLELINVFVTLAESVELGQGRIRKCRLALTRFARELFADDPHADLRGFLQRYESSDEVLKSRALTDRNKVIDQWPEATRRNDLNAALNLLITVPPEERQLPQGSMRSRVSPRQLLERLPPEDRQLLQQLRADSDRRRVPRQGLNDAGLLIRFGAELVKRRCGGLSEWLAMQGDDRHAEAKQLFETYMAGMTPGANRNLPSAVARLQRLAGTQNSDRIPIRAAAQSNAGYAPNFPQAEARSIDAAIAAKRGILQEITLAGYRDALIRFSTWLRQQRTHDRPAYSGGLQNILEIARSGDLPEVQRLRKQCLRENGGANGYHKRLTPALMMLLDHHTGQALQEGQPATPQPILSTNSLDLNNLPDPAWFDFPELDSLSGPQHSVEVQATHWSDHAQSVPAFPANSQANSEEWFQRCLAEADEVVSSQTAQALPVQPATPMPASPAMSETNSEMQFQLFLAEVADVVASQPAEALPAAPPTGDLITAMSRLREARRHGAPQSLATTAGALGLDARQLAAYVTDDGNLHTNPLVQQWLLTLPGDELDALLRYQDNG
ncbi:MAG: hypothetical protein JF606_26280 [Burkholderiales bacterium]|nr:hypothetical protein [Burkholderiales bacterium]